MIHPLLASVQRRVLLKRLHNALGGQYSANVPVRQATILSASEIQLSGQRYPMDTSALGLSPGAGILVKNVARLAAPVYAPAGGGGAALLPGGAGGAGSSSGTAAGSASGTSSGTTVAGMANPMAEQDDLIVGGVAGAPARLAVGTGGQVLTVDPTSGHVAWDTPSGGGVIWAPLTNGAVPDLIYSAAGDVIMFPD